MFACESGVCAFTGEWQSFPAKEKEGILAVCTHALGESCVGAAEGSALSGAACGAGWVSVWVCGDVCEPQGPGSVSGCVEVSVQQRAPIPRAAGSGGPVKHPITYSI